jgi:ABC-type sulfate transport system permease component
MDDGIWSIGMQVSNTIKATTTTDEMIKAERGSGRLTTVALIVVGIAGIAVAWWATQGHPAMMFTGR